MNSLISSGVLHKILMMFFIAGMSSKLHDQENNAEIDKINEAINYLLDITKPAEIGFKI